MTYSVHKLCSGVGVLAVGNVSWHTLGPLVPAKLCSTQQYTTTKVADWWAASFLTHSKGKKREKLPLVFTHLEFSVSDAS